MRQQTFEKKDGCLLRQQILVDQLLGLNRFNFLQIVPKKDYYMCTSSLQVIVVIYKLNLQVHLSVHINVLSV
jgi:hypothetical protein